MDTLHAPHLGKEKKAKDSTDQSNSTLIRTTPRTTPSPEAKKALISTIRIHSVDSWMNTYSIIIPIKQVFKLQMAGREISIKNLQIYIIYIYLQTNSARRRVRTFHIGTSAGRTSPVGRVTVSASEPKQRRSGGSSPHDGFAVQNFSLEKFAGQN